MQTGKVKKWIEHRGFCFIAPDNGDPDLFTHVSQTNGKALMAGDRVEFLIASDLKTGKPIASEVRVIGAS